MGLGNTDEELVAEIRGHLVDLQALIAEARKVGISVKFVLVRPDGAVVEQSVLGVLAIPYLKVAASRRL